MQRPRPALERMQKEMEKVAKPADGIAPATPKPDTDAQPGTGDPKPKTEPSTADPKPKTEPGTGDAPKTAPATTDDAQPDAKLEQSNMPEDMAKAVRGKDGKVQPWKLANYYKDRFGDAQAEIAKLKTEGLATAEKQDYLTRIEKAEARLKEYDDEMRFTNYSKSEEFKTKYQAPYDKAWKVAMSEIGELTVPNPDGSQRSIVPQDILDLVNMPLGRARAQAEELYGVFADDVMTHRKEIKRLADEQNAALEEAKLNGGKREKERSEMQSKTKAEISQHVQQTFKQALSEALKHPEIGEFFNPKEGDEAWNQALEAGKQLFKKVYQQPDDPSLTPKQRAELVEAHAAIFNRSAAFGPMRRLIKGLRKELAEVKKENEGFKGSRPDASGGSQAPAAGVNTSGMTGLQRMQAKLAALAK